MPDKDLTKLLGERSFALMEREGTVYVLLGTIHAVASLTDADALAEQAKKPLAFALPYRMISERGFEAKGEEPFMALVADEIYAEDMAAFRTRLPETPIILSDDIKASISDTDYAEMVATFQKQEIEGGHCSQTTLSRKFEGRIHDFTLDHALSLYRTILFPQGQYMTVLFCDRSADPQHPHCIIGATPERHLTITDDHALMIPIAGTLRKEDQATFAARLEAFINDPKEINELFQVVDEELKMMGRICPEGGTIRGPFLREIGSVVHTEYELYGNRGLEPIDALRLTLHAPTVVGGPMESAARIIAKYEPTSRRYYGGEIGIYVPKGAQGNDKALLDCAIALRCAEVFDNGQFAIQAGGGLVRDSDPMSETRESRAKAMGMMAFLLNEPNTGARYLSDELRASIQETFAARNQHLSNFWIENQEQLWKQGADKNAALKIVIVNNEDDFAFMISHACRGLGYQTDVVDTFAVTDAHLDADLLILGPGPGDPNDETHPRMLRLRQITHHLLDNDKPFLGVCLGHQMLSHCLGFKVARQSRSTQGMQRDVNVFGRRHKLGFYNSFAPVLHPLFAPPPEITYDLDEEDRMIAIKGLTFAGFQFHPESIMSETGIDLLKQALEGVLR